MRLFVVCGVLAVLMLAGCAETPAELNDVDVDHDQADDGNHTVADGALTSLTGTLVASLDNLTVMAGMPFNVTLDYTGDNATNASALVWQVSFTNETGNATSYNGTGLPAVFMANLTTPGNVTVTGLVTGSNSTAAFEAFDIAVISAVVEEIDPCAGVPAQDPISMSGIVGAGAANSGLVTSNNFEVGPCQRGFVVVLSTTASDTILRLILPDGTEIEEDSGFIGASETIAYRPGGILPEGTYNAQVRPYAAVVDTYEIEITFDE